MTMSKRASILLSIVLPILFVTASVARGHEGDTEEKVVVKTDQMNVRVGRTATVEVLLKYLTPKPAEEMALLVFLTRLKTNAPVEGATISVTIDHPHSSRLVDGDSNVSAVSGRPIAVTASATATPGLYEAHLTFPKVAEYDLVLTLGGEDPGAEVRIAGIDVPGAEGTKTVGWERLPLLISALALFVLAGARSYRLWILPHRNELTASPRTEGAAV